MSIDLVSCVIILRTWDAEVWLDVYCCEKQVGIWLSKVCLTVQRSCWWRVTSQTLFMLTSWAFQKYFRHQHNFIQGLLSCMPPISSSETAFSFCLLIQPSQHGTQKTKNLNFSVAFEILLALGGSHGLVLEGVIGPAGGTCPSGAGTGNKAVCLRHLRHCQVPVFKKLNRAPLTTATRFPVIKIGFWALSSIQIPA